MQFISKYILEIFLVGTFLLVAAILIYYSVNGYKLRNASRADRREKPRSSGDRRIKEAAGIKPSQI